MILGGVAVLLVVGLAFYFLVLAGGGEEDTGLVTSAPTGAAPSPEVTESTVPKDVDNKFQVGRDPFAPLSVEAEKVVPADSSDDPSDTPDGSGTNANNGGSNTNPQPTTSPAPTVSASPSPTQTNDPDPQPTSYKVTLKSVNVSKDSATILVSGKRYVVKVKDLFTNSKTGPFKLTWVGERADGKDTAKVVFGSDAPVELVQNNSVTFQP
jgi:hypothetical protein